MNIPLELQSVLEANPQIISGAVRFKGTRVPAQALIDTLDGGTLDEFLEGWPDVSRQAAEAVIRWQQNQARRTFGLEFIASMRVLLDNNVNQRFARLITGHEVVHARQQGWGELYKGDLIAAAEAAGFTVRVTADKNMRYQQNLADRRISISILNSLFLKWNSIAPLAPQVQRTFDLDLPSTR